jgi:hypothetical protein
MFMSVTRTMVLGSVIVGLATGATWTPRPAVGQPPAPPAATNALPYQAPDAPASPAELPTTPAPPEPPTAFFQPMQGMAVGGRSQSQTQITQLAQKYAKATKEDEKKDLRKKLSDALGKQFDQLAERQQKELQDLEKQVADLKALLKKRHDNRESIIDRRLEQVLQDAEGLGWSTPSGTPRGAFSGGGFGGNFGGGQRP